MPELAEIPTAPKAGQRDAVPISGANPNRNKWTIMFYFAGDDPMSALVVSQIKDIKDAGYQKDTDVLIHYDSNKLGAPTRLYDVNKYRKGRLGPDGGSVVFPNGEKPPDTMIGDGRDPFVRNFIEDIIDPEDIVSAADRAIAHGLAPELRQFSKKLADALLEPDTVPADASLRNFVGFCRENYPAEHYMLVVIGHGSIVGNDTFLPDTNPVSAVSLKQLEEIVRDFAEQVKPKGTLELLALHSCSMSNLEVAYQLKGTANYLIASEGLSYVGSWPYRQFLKKIFNNTEPPEPGEDDHRIEVPELVKKLYYLTLFASTDFMLSGYSLDLNLINLHPDRFTDFQESFVGLIKALKLGLDDPRENQLIVAAHGQSQSYWGENYTDLYDFCECLSTGCAEADKGNETKSHTVLLDACEAVIKKLEDHKHNEETDPSKVLVHCAENFGPLFEYSHGLSIYFPWSKPFGNLSRRFARRLQTDAEKKADPAKNPPPRTALELYEGYAINHTFGESWVSFLKDYWNKTKRPLNRRDQAKHDLDPTDVFAAEPGDMSLESFSSGRLEMANAAAPVVGGDAGAFEKDGAAHDKDGAAHDKDGSGHGPEVPEPSIKNFPVVLRTIIDRNGKPRVFPMSAGLKATIEAPPPRRRRSNNT